MTKADVANGTSAGSQRYREAERVFWGHYGLTASEHFVRAGQARTRLRVQEVGSGQPVLFVHGTGGAGAYFAPLIRELDGFRCLVLDRPGWGLSEPIDFAGHDYNTLVADLLRDVLDGLGVDRAHLVGGSIGNHWSLRLAQAHPSRVERVVCLGGMPLPEFGVPKFIKLLASPLGRVIARLGEKEGVMRKQLSGIGHASTVQSGTMEAFLSWRVAEARQSHFLRHERAMVQAMQTGHGFVPGIAHEDSDFAGLTQPVLFVYGTSDPLGSVDLWRRKIDLIPHGEFHLVDRAGHLPWYDDPKGVGGRVQRFLTT